MALGADGIELDVRLSRDEVVVVHHDETLDRTTNGRGAVAGHTSGELARLDAGFHFSGNGAFPFRSQGIGVPRLEQVLERYPGVPLIIELKTPDRVLAHKTIDALRVAGAVSRTALGSYYYRVLRAARHYEPSICTGAAQEETRWALYRSWIRWPLGRPPYGEFQVPERAGSTTVVTRRFVAHAHQARLPVKVWTVDDRSDIDRLLDWGVDAIISDRPDVAVDVVRSRFPGSKAKSL